MRIISWNTNGLRATAKLDLFYPLFKKLGGDIVCLQEVKAEKEQLPADIQDVSGFESFFESSRARKGYSGVATYSNVKPCKVEYGIGDVDLDIEGRTIVLYFEKPFKFALMNCYFPNGGGAPERLEYKLRFYDAFLKKMKKVERDYPVILCGDVNVAHEEIDIARPKENENHVGFLRIERDWMDEVLGAGFIDVFRKFNPGQKDAYTYWDQKSRARDRNVGWRIDYFIVSPKIISRIKKITHHTEYYGSDHCPISIEIE